MAIFVLMLVSLACYFIPSFVANSKQHPFMAGIFLLNLCLGWTIVGWVVALVWAVSPPATK